MIGLVENMAGYACPHCGEVSDPFGQGGAEAAAGEMGMPFPGRITLAIDIRRRSDAGAPPEAGDDAPGAPYHPNLAKGAAWLEEGPSPPLFHSTNLFSLFSPQNSEP